MINLTFLPKTYSENLTPEVTQYTTYYDASKYKPVVTKWCGERMYRKHKKIKDNMKLFQTSLNGLKIVESI